MPTKKKLCAVAIPPVPFCPAVVGSCAARENEDASGWSVSGLRIIVEGPVGNSWSEERNPDKAKLLQQRLTFSEFYYIDYSSFTLSVFYAELREVVDSLRFEIPALLVVAALF